MQKRRCTHRFFAIAWVLDIAWVFAITWAFALSAAVVSDAQNGKQHPSFEMLAHRMDVDVDGAPNAYGPPGMQTLDILLNAHYLNRADKEIVGYLIDEHGRPVLQGPKDPFPGYYISQTAFTDIENQNVRDPRRYVDARKVNYVVRGTVARRRGVQVGDFVSVYSKRTRIDAFGPRRFFWGTDMTGIPCTYRQAVTLFTEELPWLQGADLELVMGRALCDWLGWSFEALGPT